MVASYCSMANNISVKRELTHMLNNGDPIIVTDDKIVTTDHETYPSHSQDIVLNYNCEAVS